MGYVYILQMGNGRYYVGSTENLMVRLQEHQSGSSPYTSKFLPVTLVFKQEFLSIQAARKAEYWIKKQKDKRIIEMLIAEGKLRKQFG